MVIETLYKCSYCGTTSRNKASILEHEKNCVMKLFNKDKGKVFKGQVNTIEELDNIKNPKVGDSYKCNEKVFEEDESNFVIYSYIGKGKWKKDSIPIFELAAKYIN